MAIMNMYQESDEAQLVDALREIQFATLVTHMPDRLECSHVPMFAKETEDGLTLESHVARRNEHWRCASAGPSIAIFQGPQAYISPGWYPSKQEHGKVVPTWNYLVVHAHGLLEAIDDRNFLLAHIDDLTKRNESDRAEPWGIDDAPGDYIPKLTRGIVGLRLKVSRLDGASKMGQNRTDADRKGAVAGLSDENEFGASAVAEKMLSLIPD
ncbi:MAG: FMN-binding negative transcriptional regulator [Hyphomicrobiales bacterium]